MILVALLVLVGCGGSAGTASGPAFAPTAPGSRTDLSLEREAPKPQTGAEVAAPAATAAPEATSLPPEAAGEGAAAGAPPALVGDTSSAAGGAAGMAPPPRVQQYTPIKAGEVDDNADFGEYLSYLAERRGSGVRPVDVSERYILTVTNSRQQPVLDAHVALYDGQRQVWEGRTYAGGQTIVFPRALGLGEPGGNLEVQIEKNGATASGTLVRGQDDTQSFVLDGAEAFPQQPQLDVLFLLDATGSMGDEIDRIQLTITDIAERINQLEQRPDLRFGLVSYRDRGDAYVTHLDSNFTGDVASFSQALNAVRADGGGDTPEDLNEGLSVALQQMSWRDNAVRLVFLVADAPAHLDYGQEFDYVQGAQVAVARGVKIYPVAASNSDADAEYQFRQLAQQTLSTFLFLTYQQGQASGDPGETTTHNVDPGQFTVDRLDDLIVQVVQRELNRSAGTQ
jgi:hypothetical protein